MKWVTRKQIRVNRVATAWLIRRFIDPQAEFIFVEPDEVAQVQREQNAKGFDGEIQSISRHKRAVVKNAIGFFARLTVRSI